MKAQMVSHSGQARVGLVLSGGGALGAYQAGVVKALYELEVQIHAVSGTSVGALNGIAVAEADGDLGKAAHDLEELWTGLIENSPIEFRPGKFLLNFFISQVVTKWPQIVGVVSALRAAGLVDLSPLPLAETESLEKSLESRGKRVLNGEGLPLYVSIFESGNELTDLKHAVGGKLLDLWDTPPAEFRHIQSLPRDERMATILASAAIPLILQARRLGPDGRRYVDGAVGGHRTRQGVTPATPLIEDAGCTGLIVTHNSDGSLWRRDLFPGTTVIEIRPGRTVRRKMGLMGELRDGLNFSDDILSWIDQGYEDALRCVGNAKRALNLVHRGREARARRDRAVAALDSDGFGSA